MESLGEEGDGVTCSRQHVEPSPLTHTHTINILYAYALYTDYRVAILVVVLYCVHMEGLCVAR